MTSMTHHPLTDTFTHSKGGPMTQRDNNGQPSANNPWTYFPGGEALQAWVTQIRQLLAAANRDDGAWTLAGTAIVIESPDVNDTTLLLEAMSLALGFGYEVWMPGVREVSEWPADGVGAPRLLYVPSGEWQECPVPPEFHPVAGDVVARASQFDPFCPEFVVTTVTSYDNFAATLLGPGRFGRAIRVDAPTTEQYGRMFMAEVGEPCLSDGLLRNPTRVGRLLRQSHSSVTALRMSALKIRRGLTDPGQRVEWRDLIDLTLQGLIDSSPAVANDGGDLESVAWHEAGHALVAYLDSGGVNVPELISITPTADYAGVMLGSIDFHHLASERMRYSDFRHKIRVSLAGRAAEELAYGARGVSAGCNSDLESASRLAHIAFSRWGFSPEMENAGVSSGNLFTVWGGHTASEYQHVETLCRTFLAQQYRDVMDLLAQHHEALAAVKATLMANAVLDGTEFLACTSVRPFAA